MTEPLTPDSNECAKAAYAAYAQSTGGKTFDGRPMPAWADLPDQIKSAWQAGAAAAANAEAPTVDGKVVTIPLSFKSHHASGNAARGGMGGAATVYASAFGAPDHEGVLRSGAVVVLYLPGEYAGSRSPHLLTAGEAREIGKTLISQADYLDKVAQAIAVVDGAEGVPG